MSSIKKYKYFFQNKKNLIGIGILLVGAIALFLSINIFLKKNDNFFNIISNKDVNETIEQEVRAPNRALGEKPKSVYKKQRKIADREIVGEWQSYFDNIKALLQINKGRYRLFVIPLDQPNFRYYSFGTLKLNADIITLTPDDYSNSPEESEGVQYNLLAQGDMPIMVSINDKKMIWQVPSDDIGIYVPPHHPILSQSSNNVIIWDVLK